MLKVTYKNLEQRAEIIAEVSKSPHTSKEKRTTRKVSRVNNKDKSKRKQHKFIILMMIFLEKRFIRVSKYV